MNLRRWFLVALFTLVLVVPPPLLYGGQDMEPALPVATLGDALPHATLAGAYDSPCGEPAEAAVFRVILPGGGDYLLSLYKADQRPMVFLLIDNADGDETSVWAGVLDVEGRLLVRRTFRYGEFVAAYPNACTLFTQREA